MCRVAFRALAALHLAKGAQGCMAGASIILFQRCIVILKIRYFICILLNMTNPRSPCLYMV